MFSKHLFGDNSGEDGWPLKQKFLFWSFFLSLGTSQGTLSSCWMSGVRRLLKLRFCSPVSAIVALLDRLRLRFLFFARLACHSSTGHTSEVNFCSVSTSCGEEDGELVCSCDLSEMGERICSLLMIRDILLVLGPAWAEAGLRSRDEDEVTRSEAGPELGTPLVTLSLILSAAETFIFTIYLIYL